MTYGSFIAMRGTHNGDFSNIFLPRLPMVFSISDMWNVALFACDLVGLLDGLVGCLFQSVQCNLLKIQGFRRLGGMDGLFIKEYKKY